MDEFNPFQGTYDTMESLADQIGQVLDCPITIEDEQHRLLAYSSHEQNFTDEARLATIIGRRVPASVIDRLWEAGVLQALNQSEDPVQVPLLASVGLGHRVAISIRKGTDVLGYIWAITTHAFTAEENRLLKLAAKAASPKLLQLRTRGRKEQERQQEFFWKLLTDQGWTQARGVEMARQLKLQIPAETCVVIFQLDEFISAKTYDQISYLVTMHPQVRALLHVLDQTQLVLLIGHETNKRLSEATCVHFLNTIVEQMKERFHIEVAQAVCGRVIQSLGNIHVSYREALDVLQLKQLLPEEMANIYDYRNLGFYRFLPAMLEQRRSEESEHPVLADLRKYDDRNHSNLVITLEIFLKHDQNVKQAATILHIHVNTMLYRLKRISEVGDLDLTNTAVKVSLYLELLLDKLIGQGRIPSKRL